MTGYDAQTAERAPETSKDPVVAPLAALFLCGAALGGLLALLAAWLWVVLSDPPRVPLARDGGLFLDERALDRQAGITMWFVVVGLVGGAVAGLLLGWWGQRFGWVCVVAVLVACGLATVLARYLGIHVFGAQPQQEAAGASPGDLIRIDVSLGTWVAYLGWPVGGLVGVLAAVSGWRRSSFPPHSPASSATLR